MASCVRPAKQHGVIQGEVQFDTFEGRIDTTEGAPIMKQLRPHPNVIGSTFERRLRRESVHLQAIQGLQTPQESFENFPVGFLEWLVETALLSVFQRNT